MPRRPRTEVELQQERALEAAKLLEQLSDFVRDAMNIEPRFTVGNYEVRLEKTMKAIYDLHFEMFDAIDAMKLLASGATLARTFPDGNYAGDSLTPRQITYLYHLARMEEASQDRHENQCDATTRHGLQCSRARVAGGFFCGQHMPRFESSGY